MVDHAATYTTGSGVVVNLNSGQVRKFATGGLPAGIFNLPFSPVAVPVPANDPAEAFQTMILNARDITFSVLVWGTCPTDLATNLAEIYDELTEDVISQTMGVITYTADNGVERAIDCYLTEIGEPTEWANRYPYTNGSGSSATIPCKVRCPSPMWYDPTELTFNGTYAGAEMVVNPGFETAGALPPVFADWVQTLGDGALADELAVFHAGAHAAKLTSGPTSNTLITQDITVLAGHTYTLSFWTQGDGADDGRYGVYDVTNGADIVATTQTGVTGAAYAEVDETFDTPAGCVAVQIRLLCPAVNAGVCYFDDVSLIETSGDIACPNSGNVWTYPRVTFTGIVDDPRIIDAYGNEFELDLTTVAGDVLYLDFDPLTFTATKTTGAVVTDVRNLQTLVSREIKVANGAGTLTFSGGVTSVATILVALNPCYKGHGA